MILGIAEFLILTVGFHLVMDFICKKADFHNRYPLLTVRLERGEMLPVALFKYVSDIFIWGLRVTLVMAISLAPGNPSSKSYWQMEAEREANAQKMVDDYGGKLSDYL